MSALHQKVTLVSGSRTEKSEQRKLQADGELGPFVNWEQHRPALTAEETLYVRTTTNRDTLQLRFGRLQRVRFIVSKRLAGPLVLQVYADATS